jgi:hypothetical protein
MVERWWGVRLEGTWLRKISEGSHTSPSSKFGGNSAIKAFGGLKIHPNKTKRKQKVKGFWVQTSFANENQKNREGNFKGLRL